MHCQQRQYSFQIKKCENVQCCGEIRTPAEHLKWLPDPTEDKDNVGHFMPFLKVYGQVTTEEGRLTYKDAKTLQKSHKVVVKKSREKIEPWVSDGLLCESSVMTAQNAQAIVQCVECSKPRVIYAKSRLTDRQKMQLALSLSEFEYSCGAPATIPTHSLHGKVFTRLNINCESIIELPYYSASIGRSDLCCFCASEGASIDQELKTKFKTVLPVCNPCHQINETPCLRPYGPGKKD